MAKYGFWQSSKTPLNVKKIDTGSANPLQDWNRINETISTLTIDGESLQSILRKEKRLQPTDPLPQPLFNNANELKEFFKRNLFKKIPPGNLPHSAEEYLMKLLHQGGLLNPVSGALLMLTEPGGVLNGVMGPTGAMSNGLHRSTAFVTTENGFRVQEILKQHTMTDIETGDLIRPKAGKDSVLEGQATFKVEFGIAGRGGSPKITLVNHTINYHNNDVKNLMDNRNIAQKVLDKLKRITKIEKLKTLLSLMKIVHEEDHNVIHFTAST